MRAYHFDTPSTFFLFLFLLDSNGSKYDTYPPLVFQICANLRLIQRRYEYLSVPIPPDNSWSDNQYV